MAAAATSGWFLLRPRGSWRRPRFDCCWDSVALVFLFFSVCIWFVFFSICILYFQICFLFVRSTPSQGEIDPFFMICGSPFFMC
jgi:hypothetical protein